MHRWRHTYCVFRSRAIGLTLRLLIYWTCGQKEAFLHGLVQPSVLTARQTFFFFLLSNMLHTILAGFPMPLQKVPVVSWLSGTGYLSAATPASCALCSMLAARKSVRFLLVINKLDAQNLFYNKFISCLYMFRAPCAYRQEVKIVLYSLWYHYTL